MLGPTLFGEGTDGNHVVGVSNPQLVEKLLDLLLMLSMLSCVFFAILHWRGLAAMLCS